VTLERATGKQTRSSPRAVASRELYGETTTSSDRPIPLDTATMSFPSFHRFVLRRPWLTKIMMPWANWYVNAAGYRQLGLL